MSEIKKIGMYSTDEILEFMTEGEGRSFLGRSMFDAIYFEIERLNKENEELKKIQCTFLGTGCKVEIERLKGALQTHEILLKSNTLEIERLNNKINSIFSNFQQFINSYKNDKLDDFFIVLRLSEVVEFYNDLKEVIKSE